MITEKRPWLYDLALVAVLLVAAVLRFSGVDWGEGQHQHPDELFLSGVTENLRAHTCRDAGVPVDACPRENQRWLNTLEYFNTATSTLNPANRGAGFFVYGNLPIILVRLTYELLGDNAGPLKYLGRQFSASADLFSILILYLLVARLYSRRVGLLAAAFSALAVMQIQQSHFYTVDLFMLPFMLLALYFAVRIAYDENRELGIGSRESGNVNSKDRILNIVFFRGTVFWNTIFFGLALGMAAACKINAVVLAVALPAALAIRFSRKSSVSRNHWKPITVYLFAGGLVTLLVFRIFQPYAFNGLFPSPEWLKSMQEIRGQATGLADLPWNLQWARRTHLYSFANLTLWGLGLPLGVLAWAGFALMGWRILKGERRHILLWTWTALYFGWQSFQFNATMRYQLPIYPMLAMMAAWCVFEFARSNVRTFKRLAVAVGAFVLLATTIWAFAFASIYSRDETRVAASRWIYENVPGPITLHFTDGASQPLPFPYGATVESATPYLSAFNPQTDTTLTEILLPHIQPLSESNVTVSLAVLDAPDAAALATARIIIVPSIADERGASAILTLNHSVQLSKGITYYIRVETTGPVILSGATIANETDYDWSLPFRIGGYDAFGGIYRGDLNLQVYWDDNADKLARLQSTLDQTDYLFIPTNHQYAQITRLPERYPLTTVYYRELVGCPSDADIIWCYRVAEPGMFTGRLGFELVQTFVSYPTLGQIVINDQAAEEAFTFYDHPKVLIFKKTADYDATKVAATLGAVDLSKVVHLLPNQAADYEPPKSLMLPPDRLASQQAGGTWSQLFNYDWIQNKYPALGVVIWYLFIFLLGLITYPLTRRALPGLSDKGYALSRSLGLAILAYLPWLMGSLGIAYTRESIAAVLAGLALVGAWQAWAQRDALRAQWESNRRAFLITEAIFLALFLFDVGIRLVNPDLWHPSKGGERPMDFSYFNAVLKSTSFPPYDPWFAGGYINYYYYGFVLVGTPVKLLGIVPSIAYNFILPTLFSLVGISAYSIGSNLVESRNSKVNESRPSTFDLRLITGLASTTLILLLGNLGTLRTIWMTFQTMGAPQGIIGAANFFQRFTWGLDGFAKSIAGAPIPIRQGDWYWLPSRVIPAPNDVEPITEFPLFTFLYSDLHAHMIVLFLALFIIAWGLSYILALRSATTTPLSSIKQLAKEHWPLITVPLLFGALVLGAIYPTNTWDAFTYFPLAAVAVGYALFNAVDFKENRFNLPPLVLRFAFSITGGLTLVALARLLYQPYFHWFGSGYGEIAAWTGSHTPLNSYFTHWGLFLFLILAWMIWETREWMAATPLADLSKLKPYQVWIEITLAAFFVVLFFLLYRGARISLIALPLAFWAALLILRPKQDDAKRWVLFMIGTSLALTLAVELIVLVGDIGRMNTVFKLYLQGWTMLAISAAASLGWILPAVASLWTVRWRGAFQFGLTLLVAGAFFFTLTGTADKMRDRVNRDVPHTFDSMTFMATSQHWDSTTLDLGQDYRAIRWMQDNVQGSPVIVEGNCPEYRWCTRFTIYTGLPGVLGWNWHQRQQRGFVEPLIVENRLAEITSFYTTIDQSAADAFLQKYDVRYIVVGQVENIYYAGEGLLKFETHDGGPWTEVYRDGQTAIYQVNQ